MNEIHRNQAELEGVVQDLPAYSHENHGKPFYRCLLEIPRLSGQADILPLLLPETLREAAVPGERLRVRGQLRSYNNRSGQGSRLVLSTYVLSAEEPAGESCNRITLGGVLCKAPIYRRTPLGRSICDLMLAVSRRYGEDAAQVLDGFRFPVLRGDIRVQGFHQEVVEKALPAAPSPTMSTGLHRP